MAVMTEQKKETCTCASQEKAAVESYKTEAKGEVGTLEYRVHFKDAEDKNISPWHTVPIYAGGDLLNYVCEIPRNTRAKYEVATSEVGNPIKQDSKKGKPRSYAIDILWNYGMFPQTWEDPTHANEECGGYIGDNDPVDVVEIGDKTAVSGGIYKVKPVAALAMIDEGELDWKVLAIAASDPRCELVNTLEDLEEHFPGTVSAVREWFRTYKTFDGKPLNKFALKEEAMDREYTLGIIAETHGFWRRAVQKDRRGEKNAKFVVADVAVCAACVSEEMVEREKEIVVEKEEISKDLLERVVKGALESQPHGHKRTGDVALESEASLQQQDNKRVELVSAA